MCGRSSEELGLGTERKVRCVVGLERLRVHRATGGRVWVFPWWLKSTGLLTHLEPGSPGQVPAPVPARSPSSFSPSAERSQDPSLTGLLPWLHERMFLAIWAVRPVRGCYLYVYGMCVCVCLCCWIF